MVSRRVGTLRGILVGQNEAVRKELRKVVENTSNNMLTYLQTVTGTWKRKPAFIRQIRISRRLIAADVNSLGPNGQIFKYVDEGTAGPYQIRPKRPGYPLRFQAGYSARTQPVARYDVGSGTASGPTVRTYEVTHPGIEAREFRAEFGRINQRQFRSDIENAFRRASRRGG